MFNYFDRYYLQILNSENKTNISITQMAFEKYKEIIFEKLKIKLSDTVLEEI